jgi:predicted thioesterase
VGRTADERSVSAIFFPRGGLGVRLTVAAIEPGAICVHHRAMPDLSRITPGLTGSAETLVTTDETAPFVGSGRIAVLATPVMINLIEAAALAAIEHLLPTGYQSLGIHLDVRHTAATPVGMRVVATAEVTAVEGRTVSFKVEARDEREVIGGGTHQRVVVSVARFDERVQRKLRGG